MKKSRVIILIGVICLVAIVAMSLRKTQDHARHEHGHGEEHVEALPAGANQMCPVMPDEKVDPSLYVEYKGKRIYVCCKKCDKRVKEDPAAWYAKVYGDGHEHDH
jgi:hypothetical protein